MTRALLRILFLFIFLGSLLGTATAQNTTQDDAELSALADAMTDAAQALVKLSSFVDANVTFCTQHAPEAGVSEAAAAWYTESGLTLLKQLKTLPDVGVAFQGMEDSFTQVALQDLNTKAAGREAEWCRSVPALLQSPE